MTGPLDVAEPLRSLKPARMRTLRRGMCVVVASESEPLVVDEATARLIWGDDQLRPPVVAASLLSTLADAGFLQREGDRARLPPAVPIGPGWTLARATLWTATVVLLAASVPLLTSGGVPHGADAISRGPNPLLSLTVALGIAIVTSVPHEFAHVLFGNTLGQRRGSVRVRAVRASATTNLTHVWAWTMSPRLAAVSAGLVVDLAFLTVALTLRAVTDSWIADVGVAVMTIRIVWQLRFHRNCDGRHIAKILLDSPSIDLDARVKISRRAPARGAGTTALWLSLLVVGAAAELSLLAVWILPAAAELLGLL